MRASSLVYRVLTSYFTVCGIAVRMIFDQGLCRASVVVQVVGNILHEGIDALRRDRHTNLPC